MMSIEFLNTRIFTPLYWFDTQELRLLVSLFDASKRLFQMKELHTIYECYIFSFGKSYGHFL